MTRVREIAPEAAVLAAAADELLDDTPVEPEIAVIPDLPVESEEVPVSEPAAAPVARRKRIPIEIIEGIGPVYRAKLMEVGIEFVADLLAAGASRKDRENLAASNRNNRHINPEMGQYG